ncbi:MAG: radical SAM protein [Deltaproteobacteria bacterium]|nr:radical SAM protein [Deltaproteobacteria bacterium]
MLQRLLYSPFLAQVVVTRRCNLACSYCNEFDKVSSPVPGDVLLRRLEHLKRLGVFAVELTGGEPLLHPDLGDLVAHARGLGFLKVMMISNAFLMDERRIEELNAAGLHEVQISVDGVEPTSRTVKVLRHLGPKLETMSRLARFRIVLSAVLGSASTAEAREVIAFAGAHGMAARVLALHGADGQFRLEDGERQAYLDISRALGHRFREAHDYRTRLLSGRPAPFKCRAGSRYLYVAEDGMVHWCSQTRADFAVPLEDYDQATLREQFHTPKRCSVHCTMGCARTSSAPDRWRPQHP